MAGAVQGQSGGGTDVDRSSEWDLVGCELLARQNPAESRRHRDEHRRVPDGKHRRSARHQQQSVREFQSDQRCQSHPGHPDGARISAEPFQSPDRQPRGARNRRSLVVFRASDGRRRRQSCGRSGAVLGGHRLGICGQALHPWLAAGRRLPRGVGDEHARARA